MWEEGRGGRGNERCGKRAGEEEEMRGEMWEEGRGGRGNEGRDVGRGGWEVREKCGKKRK